MQSYQADSAALPATTRYHLTLERFADDVVATLARLLAYVGALALLAILALAALDQLPSLRDAEAPLGPDWSAASRSDPAFAVGWLDSGEKPASYTILRHPEGDRTDIIRWPGDDGKPIAELQIYRPAIACTLNRLVLLSAGNQPKLAELFAHAGLKRQICGPAGSADWLTGTENARLRGSL